MATIGVDHSLCTKCGVCVPACSGRVYEISLGSFPQADAGKCWNCGHCVAACPAAAISHSAYPLDACPTIGEEALPSYGALLAAIQKRRSIRSFREKAVPRELIEKLLDA